MYLINFFKKGENIKGRNGKVIKTTPKAEVKAVF